MSLLLSGYVPYFHSDESTPHPDPILQGTLAASDLAGEHPRSLLDQDLPALASHIQHQLAETGRDANPIGAMLDSLAHPNIDTQRGEHPSYLAWTTPHDDNLEHSARSGRRPHVVLGRGDIGGIWADMDHDHTQTLSYSESMELPIYSLAQFLKEHPDEYDATLERPKRATVSAYYKSYAERMKIRDNFWTYTTVTDVFHLKDLENHCCCYLDPDLIQQDHDSRPGDDADEWSDYSGQYQCQKCLPYRYAILGFWQLAPFANVEGDRSQKKNSRKRRQHFLLRCKTLALATGTFDQPRKILMSTFQSKPTSENTIPAPTPTASAHSTPPSTIPLFYDTRSIDEWMTGASSPVSSAAGTCDTSLPIVIVGTGLSAADAILLVRERQPHRPIIHLYRYATASEPSPLKRCHKEVYPEYASIWTLMKKCATRLGRTETSLASSLSPAPGSYYKSCYEYSNTKPKEPCNCQQAAVDETMLGTISPQPTPPPCHGCVYTGLADATLSGWDPLNGQVEIILNSGLRVQRRVAAIGIFIGKQVNMGFLKGSLALDYLQAPSDSALLNIPSTAPYRNKLTLATMSTPSRRQPEKPLALDTQVHMLPQLRKQGSLDTTPEIPTPPSTPPFLPIEGEVLVNQDDNTDTVDPQIRDENLTALKPIVTDMWTLRLVPAPRAARPLRPSLAQRAFTPHLASTANVVP
ncbi:Oxidative stress-induced growth inhibitor 2 [Actinomortierella wolfii]|nr:Oxidative stress-induced growth inhibitor 2 [Actinomortierella wolfii]